jgi:hypothetical protein
VPPVKLFVPIDTCADEALKGRLLAWGEDVSCGAEKNDDPASAEFRRSEAAGVLRAVDAETVLRTQRFDGGNAVRDRVVAERGRLREDQRTEPRPGVIAWEDLTATVLVAELPCRRSPSA